MKILICMGAAILWFSAFSYSQAVRDSELKVKPDAANKRIGLDFTKAAVIDNLLIRISDSSGLTLFLDNKYRFSGHYQKTIDLVKQGKGTYFLEIIEDNKHTNKKIVLE